MNAKPNPGRAAPNADSRPTARVLLRVLSILALGSALGFAFNAANPLGVRWEGASTAVATPAPEAARPALATVSLPAPASLPPSPAPTVSTGASPPSATGPAQAGVISLDPNLEAVPSASFHAPSPTTWVEVKPLARDGQVVLVDSRPRPIFDAGHIPGAVALPEDSPAADIDAFRAQHGTNAHVVVYCSSTSCSQSFRLAYRLAKDYGFTHVQYMTGGYFEYQRDAGLAGTNTPPVTNPVAVSTLPPNVPLVGGAVTGRVAVPAPGTVFHVNPQPVSWAKVGEWVDQRQALLVDTRSEEAFQAGHVPGAVSLPSESGPDRIEAFRRQYGTNRVLIVYGEAAGSMRAFVAGRQLMREAGFNSVRFVVEGYKEWRNQPATSGAH